MKNNKELIKVHIFYKDKKTKCMCLQGNKLCNRDCEKDVVEYDKYRGWQDCLKNRKEK